MSRESPSPDRFEYALLPDSPDVRGYLEFAHLANADLHPAVAALELAIEWHQTPDAPDTTVLVDFAVMSYCRAFAPSNVRTPLPAAIVPERHQGVHQQIYGYRNTTVAHSQSDLITTLPVISIDHEHGGRRMLLGVTTGQSLPWDVVLAFVELVDAVLDVVDERIEAIRSRLEPIVQSAELIPMPEGFWSGAAWATEFDPRTKRAKYPRPGTMYVSLNHAQP